MHVNPNLLFSTTQILAWLLSLQKTLDKMQLLVSVSLLTVPFYSVYVYKLCAVAHASHLHEYQWFVLRIDQKIVLKIDQKIVLKNRLECRSETQR